MKTGKCQCGNRLFFSNYRCLACGSDVGRCDRCNALTSMSKVSEDHWSCDACDAAVQPCGNHAHAVCNVFVDLEKPLCQWCEFTTVTPDLQMPENIPLWIELERAKRRLLLELKQLEMPPYVADINESHPLSFQFLANKTLDDGTVEPVFTGHANGVITVNTQEADSVHREKTRVALREPQRTLIGHLRHEVGHYIDWAYASRVAAEAYQALFGDPAATDYEQAKNAYYAQGATADWAESYVSAYATMHPWEDFAETVNAYLDIMAIAATANDQGIAKFDISPNAAADKLVNGVLAIAIIVSEFNLDLGLSPLLPERLPPTVIAKLSFVHQLRNTKLKRQLAELQAST